MNGEGAAAKHVRPLPRSWGAELIRESEVRFRLWAPGLDRLTLVLDGSETPMERDAEGWFELVVEGVQVGASYAFQLPDGKIVPDPASRAQLRDVHGPSVLVDPASYRWRNAGWRGRPWEEAVIYELHLGAFTPEGTFAAAREKLPYLAELGVTAVELMPVAHFAGERGWGYDGVLPYAPHPAYGGPDDMKAFVDAAHGHGLMVLLDVVYNHFGPEGNYLASYAPQFFHPERHTPWGAAIAYDQPPVRRFFIENALYWLDEFRLDGLRFDAIDNIRDDDSDPEIMVEIAKRIRAEFADRHTHLTTEDSRNITRLHERGAKGEATRYTAEWNDDFHNVAHVIATGETEGYYEDFAEDPWAKLGRALAEGYVYQGEFSDHVDAPRGVPCAHLPPTAFVDFLQNHDQVGNRALGERLVSLAEPRTLELMTAMLLLSPHVPLLFMGEEYGEQRPFLFFTDFTGDLAHAVRDGRRREFAHFAGFSGSESDIPDPNAPETFLASKLDWDAAQAGCDRLARIRRLLALRRDRIVPLLHGCGGDAGRVLEASDGAIVIDWTLNGGILSLRANFTRDERQLPPAMGEIVYADPPAAAAGGLMQARSLTVTIGSRK